jgi:transposase
VPEFADHACAGSAVLLAGYHAPAFIQVTALSVGHHRRSMGADRTLVARPRLVGRQGGRRTKHCRREIVDAILYVVDNGIKWRALPADFPPWSTVYKHFADWERQGATQDLLDALRDRARLTEGRHAAPSAGIIDSASVKAAETVGAGTRGFDAGKKINGRKRHIAVDTVGLLLCVLVTGADIQDRTAARHLLARLKHQCPSVRHLWADSGYTGTLIDWARSLFGVSIDIVAKLAGQVGFVVLHRRWVVERSLAWINQHRRCVRDYERLPEHHEAIVRWAMIHTTSKRLT